MGGCNRNLMGSRGGEGCSRQREQHVQRPGDRNNYSVFLERRLAWRKP